MKKYFIGFFAIALALGSSAFTHIAAKPSFDANLYWVAADGTDDGLKLQSQEVIDRGCNGGSFICARGYDNPQHTGTAVLIKKAQP
jgi:hypothetical protein